MDVRGSRKGYVFYVGFFFSSSSGGTLQSMTV